MAMGRTWPVRYSVTAIPRRWVARFAERHPAQDWSCNRPSTLAAVWAGFRVDLHDLFRPPYDNDGARVHSNSWGSTTPGQAYDSSANEIDDMVWNHQDLVICFAAGNDGIDANANGVVDAGSIGSQSAAKNGIVVGASESLRPEFEPSYGGYWPGDFPTDPLRSDHQADDPAGLVAFSSRGPTSEGRIKPDLVAGDLHPVGPVTERRHALHGLRHLVGPTVLL